jgi:hypothetical protein
MQTQAKRTPTNDTGGLGDLAYSDGGSLTLFPGDPATDFPVSVALKTRGRPVEISIAGNLSAIVGASGGGSSASLRLKRNGTILGAIATDFDAGISAASASAVSVLPGSAIKFTDLDCPAGDHTYTINFNPNISGTGSSLSLGLGTRILAKEL